MMPYRKYANILSRPGDSGICGAREWNSAMAESLNEATMTSVRPDLFSCVAKRRAVRWKEATSVSLVPLISILTGCRGRL